MCDQRGWEEARLSVMLQYVQKVGDEVCMYVWAMNERRERERERE